MSVFAAVSARAARSAAGLLGARPKRTAAGFGVTPAPLLAVISGCGGAGGSTLAAALGLAALARGLRVALLDADPIGAGLDTLIEPSTTGEQTPGPSRDAPPGARRVPPPRAADLSLICWDDRRGEAVPVDSMRTALHTVRRTAHLIVVDLSRRVDPAGQFVLAQATHSLLMLPVGDRPILAASRVLPRVLDSGARPGLVVRLPKRDSLAPRDVAQLLGLSLTGVVKPQPHSGDLGVGTPIGRFADRYLSRAVFGPTGAAQAGAACPAPRATAAGPAGFVGIPAQRHGSGWVAS
jgi:secretion/DNA translocation related CpaE-like protein